MWVYLVYAKGVQISDFVGQEDFKSYVTIRSSGDE